MVQRNHLNHLSLGMTIIAPTNVDMCEGIWQHFIYSKYCIHKLAYFSNETVELDRFAIAHMATVFKTHYENDVLFLLLF